MDDPDKQFTYAEVEEAVGELLKRKQASGKKTR
jgi:hypothetical protein